MWVIITIVFVASIVPVLFLIPEEILSLGKFLFLAMRTIHFLQRIGVVARIPCLGGHRHGRWGEVLHLFQVEVQFLGDLRQLCHVLLRAARVAGDEIGDDLLVEMLVLIDAVEDALEVVELLERRLAHQLQHPVAGMLWRHLQSSADMTGNQFMGILSGGLVACLVLAMVKDEVIAHATADETLLHPGDGIDGTIDVEKGGVVGVEVRTYLRMDTTGTLAFLTRLDVASPHAIHIGGGTTQVGEVAFEVGHLYGLSHLF